VTPTGETSTTQLSQHALALRFLSRTQDEVAQLRACLPVRPLAVEPAAITQIERIAHKISSAAEAFGFAEIDAIAGTIELMTQAKLRWTLAERVTLSVHLAEKIAALAAHIQHEIAEKEAERVPDGLPMSAHLPGFGARRK